MYVLIFIVFDLFCTFPLVSIIVVIVKYCSTLVMIKLCSQVFARLCDDYNSCVLLFNFGLTKHNMMKLVPRYLPDYVTIQSGSWRKMFPEDYPLLRLN